MASATTLPPTTVHPPRNSISSSAMSRDCMEASSIRLRVRHPQAQSARPSAFAETARRDLGPRGTPNPRAGIRELFRQEEASLVRPTPCGSAASPPPSRRLDSTRCRCGGIDSQLQRHVRRHDNQSLQFLRRSRPGLATTLRFPPYLMMFPDPPPLI